ncbi:holo-[acyl-carrier-protein] synthase [Holospora obtusa F1]|uniref:Holo-[acyl-carrier-protein] synthase n=1 Tax=Holospora obtusa F1 TaxID=1399147 RepID=W6TSF5_HOLOB|nr:holo-ACP synthase [Holospora obtusa]ETZ06752.1 holo-[acyl-carrier-protein] synthase [Holospora obtusa F1]
MEHNFLKSFQTVVGLGVDLLEVSRLKKKIQRHGENFLNRVFTEKEQSYCREKLNCYGHYASRFCAKEAFVKALGWGISNRCSWLDIEVFHDEKGRPNLNISEKVYTYLPWSRITTHLSISDEKHYACATVILLVPLEYL